MSAKSLISAVAAVLIAVFAVTTVAEAGCVKKAARAYNASQKDAKWYAMETIVQQISWGLWPTWVSTGKIPGYVIKNEYYNCKKEGGTYNCYAQATICKK